MIEVMLLMIVGGIGFAQAVSDPDQVTLRWLRLGGLIALPLLAISVLLRCLGDISSGPALWVCLICVVLVYVLHLLASQTARKRSQRLAATLGWTLAALTALLAVREAIAMVSAPTAGFTGPSAARVFQTNELFVLITIAVASALVGGTLMTMLLGHAYLTAGGEMSQKPFQRLTLILAALIGLRLVFCVLLGMWPYFRGSTTVGTWNTMLVISRCLVGLLAPGLFVYMVHDCVRGRANQSATGILYVLLVLVIIGEGTALGLLERTGLAF